MAWWGKLVGGAFGFMLGGPLGALLGAVLGHQVDSGARRLRLEGPPGHGGPGAGDRERTQAAFFTATFSVMGHMAKADGHVSRQEIALAEAVMSHMRLSADQRRIAIDLFNQGKEQTFNLDEVLQQLRRECHRRTTLLRMFVEIQVQAAFADGRLDGAERRVLGRVAASLGFREADIERIIDLERGADGVGRGGARPTVADAYRTLGVDPGSDDDEVRKAYRRLTSQHHPDKLVAKGLPEEMIELANEKTREIRTAYEHIMESRGQRH
jgi:DnaJ like chaperone protein